MIARYRDVMAVLALYGSGEFLPWAREVDLWCAQHSTATSDRALIVPTASAQEGDDVFRRWGDLGVSHFRALGLAAETLSLRTRDDAHDARIVDAIAGACVVFFSGGNPGYLAETCAGTPFWDAVVDAVARGTAIAGCSAGAVFLGVTAPFVADGTVDRWVSGTRLLSRAFVLPHFDALDSYEPGLRDTLLACRPADSIAVGIDEDTALCGDGTDWHVRGTGAIWTGEDGDLTAFHHGETARLTLGLSLA